jgi:hypothetical protein
MTEQDFSAYQVRRPIRNLRCLLEFRPAEVPDHQV